jgi:hypothetical protein
MARIEVTRESEDRLSDQVWQFTVAADWSAEIRVMLDYFAERTRPTTRHKMKLADGRPRQWSRMEQRAYFSGIEAKDVPLPDDVRDEAIAAVKIVVIGAQP